MRSDYALYAVATIFFILTAIAAFGLQIDSGRELWVVTTTVLGLLFVGLGYSQRPRSMTIETSTASTSKATIVEEKSETLIETTPSIVPLTEVKGIGKKRAVQLRALGILGLKHLTQYSAEDLAAKLEISPKITKKWIENAKKLAEKG